MKSFTELLQMKSVFVLYLIVACNFLANTFGCKTQQLLKNNMYVKHLIGLLTLFFFITIVTATTDTQDETIFFKKFSAAVLLYVVFLASTRTKGIFFNIFLSLIGANFLIHAYIDTLDKEKFRERIDKLRMYGRWLNRLALVVLVVGVIIYTMEKRKEYKENWKTSKFIFGNITCKNN
jgi:uncharacterized membrane protein YozB (DUF420 family)